MLTSKIYETTVSGCTVLYRVYCPAGIVKNWLRGEEPVDMSSIVFPSLDTVDPNDLDVFSQSMADIFFVFSIFKERLFLGHNCILYAICVMSQFYVLNFHLYWISLSTGG